MVTTAVAVLSGTMQAAVGSKSSQGENEGTKSFAESIGEQMQQGMNVATKVENNRGSAVPQMPNDVIPDSGANQPTPMPQPPVKESGALSQVLESAGAVKAGIMYQPVPIVKGALNESDNNAGFAAATADTTIVAPGKTEEVTVTDGIDKAGNDTSHDTIGRIDGRPTAAESPLQTASVTNATLLPVEAEGPQQAAGLPDEKDATARKADGEALAGPQGASTKKVSKKRSSAEKRAAPKDASAVGIVAADVAQCMGFPGIQSAIPVQAPVAITRAQSGELQTVKGQPAQASSAGTVSTGQQNIAGQVTTGEGKDMKADASTAKVPAGTPKVVEPPAVDVDATPKNGPGLEKTSMPAQAGAGSTDAKSQGITPPSVTHALPGSSVASGLSGGVVLGEVIAGAASTKTQSGEAGVLLASAHAGSGERNISGAAAMPPPAVGSHRTLFATPTVLEIGVPNGTQGWLKIRAEMASSGAINASLSTASPAGQEMLHRELPSLTAYLQQERIAVNAVVVHETAARTPWGSLPGGLSGGMSGQLQQRGGQERDSQRAATGFMRGTGFDGRDLAESNELSVTAPYAGGSWLSVRA